MQVIKKCCKFSTALLVIQAKNYFLHIFVKITVVMLVLWICKVTAEEETEQKFHCFWECDDVANNKLAFYSDMNLATSVRHSYHHSVQTTIVSDILFQCCFLHNQFMPYRHAHYKCN